MRSEIIFRAEKIVGNRYELCRRLAKLTRRTHFVSASTQYAIVDAFVTVANDTPVGASFTAACVHAQKNLPYPSQRL
jgi:hypothetical protein